MTKFHLSPLFAAEKKGEKAQLEKVFRYKYQQAHQFCFCIKPQQKQN